MRCTRCHRELPDGAQFCPACGTASPPAPPIPPVVGSETNPAPTDAGTVDIGTRRRRSIAPFVMTAIVLAVLVGGGIAVITSRDTGDETASGGRAGGSSPASTSTVSPPTVSTTTTITTTSTSTTSTSTTTTPAPDPNARALADLAATTDADRPTVDSHLGRWIPQLSAKREGLRWEGIDYGFAQILGLHRELDGRYGALLVSGAEYNFRIDDNPMTGWFITLADQSYATSDGALDWCRQHQIDRDNCAAKLITNDQNADGTLVLQ